MNEVLDLFKQGGVFMWPLLFLSVVALAIIFYKIVELFLFSKELKQFNSFIKKRGEDKNVSFSAIKNIFSLSKEQAYKSAEEYIQVQFDKQNMPLELINGIGSASPLLGFIGTASGMISSFQSIALADKVSVKLISSGISEALITTAYGLIIAVFCSISDSVFSYYLTTKAHQTDEFLREELYAS